MKNPRLRKYQTGLRTIKSVLTQTKYFLLLLGLYPVILWIFVYFTSITTFTHIFSSGALSTWEKISFVVDSLTKNVFLNITDPLPLSIIIFSLFATINLTMLIYALRQREKVNTKSKGATVAALAGSHCVACGGSLLAPVVTALSGGGAYISVARANTVLLIVLVINVIAIALIAHATISIAYKTAANDAREG